MSATTLTLVQIVSYYLDPRTEETVVDK